MKRKRRIPKKNPQIDRFMKSEELKTYQKYVKVRLTARGCLAIERFMQMIIKMRILDVPQNRLTYAKRSFTASAKASGLIDIKSDDLHAKFGSKEVSLQQRYVSIMLDMCEEAMLRFKHFDDYEIFALSVASLRRAGVEIARATAQATNKLNQGENGTEISVD